MVFDADEHRAVEHPGESPDVDGIDDMTQMEQTGRRRCKPCRDGSVDRLTHGTEIRMDHQL